MDPEPPQQPATSVGIKGGLYPETDPIFFKSKLSNILGGGIGAFIEIIRNILGGEFCRPEACFNLRQQRLSTSPV
jgi:hypothetical protein